MKSTRKRWSENTHQVVAMLATAGLILAVVIVAGRLAGCAPRHLPLMHQENIAP